MRARLFRVRTSELLGIRFLANVNPHSDIINFNAALASAKRKNTLDTEEIKGLFIDALDKVFCATVVNRLTLTDQRAAVGPKHATTVDKTVLDLITSIILDLRRQVKTLSSRMDDTKDFTPRGAKPRGKMIHFAARDLPAGGNQQTIGNK
ncbi:hypothetical protein CYMTET_12698 [Cymbomonas tetramitiformis]|uniref:Uncharacterized protein n=1 Tax=Cymbomonas tetramitiformis TaxID=36881 RepID=A0AAE0LBK6_9CHLO|nr:hypothetical protein CYMTET_12698 [Cymbomonas tetramitiformis]